ncbi:MAG: hypothetical protein KDC45_13635, partial [Bacteroidetes bacterium]|nr:hypothetical protein [Bacteroidota bacterium]
GTFQSNLDSLAAGSPSSYALSYSLDPTKPKPTAKFSVNQFGFYVQDTYRAMSNLNVTLGVRFDIPVLPDKPTANPTVAATTFAGGRRIKTNEVPSGNLLFSPRLGWNWDVFGDNMTQVRGGLGVFSGRTPYVWISNQYGNTGIEFGRTTSNPGPRTFTPDVDNQPGKNFGSIPTSEIDATDPDFKLPQVIRLNLGVDHTLPYGIVGTFDFLLSKNRNEILYQDVNLAGVSGTVNFSNSGNSNGNLQRYTTTLTGTSTNKIQSAYSNVIYLSNTDNGYQYSMTFQLQKQFSEGSFGAFDKGYNASFAYTYGRAYDANSGTSSQAVSNWRFNPINGNPNAPPSATSNYEQRHRIISSITYDLEFLKNYTTSVSFVYLGYSGRPYSTTYSGDVNGDGQTSNDLIYVPVDQNDINIVPTGSDTRTVAEIWAELDAYIKGDDALDKARGKFIKRNASVEPWTNRVDFRFAQQIPVTDRYGKFELTWDVINLMNLFNKDFGKTKFVNNQDDTPITYRGIISGKPAFTFNSRKRFVTSDLGSRWQMQLGIRYTF